MHTLCLERRALDACGLFWPCLLAMRSTVRRFVIAEPSIFLIWMCSVYADVSVQA